MSDLLEICQAGRLSGNDADNPYLRSSNAARAFTAGVLMKRLGWAPTDCRPSRGHSLRVKVGSIECRINFAKSESEPAVEDIIPPAAGRKHA